jgi:hypothetical protein
LSREFLDQRKYIIIFCWAGSFQTLRRREFPDLEEKEFPDLEEKGVSRPRGEGSFQT